MQRLNESIQLRDFCSAPTTCIAAVYGWQVLQSADCQAGDSFAARTRQKGSFRVHEPETVQRLVDAYEVRPCRHDQRML